jgi:hypothetical protein
MPKMIELSCSGCEQKILKQEKHWRWAVNRGKTQFYCSNGCQNKKPRIHEECHTCGKSLELLPHQHKNQSGFYYCSQSCAAKTNNAVHRTGENHPNWVDGRFRYRERGLKDICENCGETRYYLLLVHHKDRNRANNSEENWETLCYNCHALRHLVVKDDRLVVRWDELTTDEVKDLM